MPQTMLPGVLLLVAAAEAGAAAAVEAGEAASTDSSTRAVPAGLTLLALSSLDFLVPSPFGPAAPPTDDSEAAPSASASSWRGWLWGCRGCN